MSAVLVITHADSAWVRRSVPSVCLFVCLFVSIMTQKQMIPKCSNLVQGMTLEYTRSDMVLEVTWIWG